MGRGGEDTAAVYEVRERIATSTDTSGRPSGRPVRLKADATEYTCENGSHRNVGSVRLPPSSLLARDAPSSSRGAGATVAGPRRPSSRREGGVMGRRGSLLIAGLAAASLFGIGTRWIAGPQRGGGGTVPTRCAAVPRGEASQESDRASN